MSSGAGTRQPDDHPRGRTPDGHRDLRQPARVGPGALEGVLHRARLLDQPEVQRRHGRERRLQRHDLRDAAQRGPVQGLHAGTIADARTSTEAIICLGAESRAEVDRIADAALANGGSRVLDAQDHGFMYGRSFADPDGHIWEVMWMDPAVASGEKMPG